MELCKVWMEQCEATKRIEDEFRTPDALAHPIGEKLPNFPKRRKRTPAFIVEIRAIFETRRLAVYLEIARRSEPFDPSLYDEEEAPFSGGGQPVARSARRGVRGRQW